MDINILPNNEILKLSDSCFNVDYKKTLVHQVITSYFSNGRENIASQKNRSAVRGGGKNHGDKRVREEQELEQQEAQFGEVVA